MTRKRQKQPLPKDPGSPELRRAIGAALQEIRMRRGHSQESLAWLVPCDRSQITRVELGKHNPSYAWLNRIMKAMDDDMVRFARLVEQHLRSGTLPVVALIAGRLLLSAAAHGAIASR